MSPKEMIRAVRDRYFHAFAGADEDLGFDPGVETRSAMTADAGTLERAAGVLTDYGAARSADQLRAWASAIRAEAAKSNR